jgi:hypothetical protein
MSEKIPKLNKEVGDLKIGDFSMIRKKNGEETGEVTRSRVYSGDTKIAESVRAGHEDKKTTKEAEDSKKGTPESGPEKVDGVYKKIREKKQR